MPVVGVFGVLSMITEDSRLCPRWLPEDRLLAVPFPSRARGTGGVYQQPGGSREMIMTRQNNKCYLSGLPCHQPVIFIVLQNNGIY